MSTRNLFILILPLLLCNPNLDLSAQDGASEYELIYTIDVTTAPDNLIIGTVSVGLLDRNRNTFLVDNGNKQIHQFDQEGNFIRSFSREGRGPGEFLDAKSASLSTDNELLYLLDYPSSRIVVFRTSDGQYSHTIKLQSTSATQTNKIANFNGKLLLLGYHLKSDQMIHVIDAEGNTIQSYGDFIDFNDFMYNSNGKMQLSDIHTSVLDTMLLVTLAAPNRVKLYNQEFNILHEFENELLPTPWETHMTMRPDRYRVEFYSMSVKNELVSDELYLYYWMEVLDADKHEIEWHLDVRSLHDGTLVERLNFKNNFILDIQRDTTSSVYILSRNLNTYDYEIHKLHLTNYSSEQ